MDNYIEASFWAIIPDPVLSSTKLKANAKLLYAKVTSLQRSKGYCYASNKYLAEGLGIAPDTVTRLLKELADAGYLRIDVVRDVKTNVVTERRIYPTFALPEICAPLPDKYPIPPGQISDTLPDKYPIPPGQISEKEYSLEYSRENPPKAPQGGQPRKKSREPKAKPDWKPERFDGFWAFYPRGENKQGAIRAWDKLKPSDDLIDQMAVALKAQKQTESWQQGIGVPYASTWINQRRWEDDLKKGAGQSPPPPPPDMRGGLPAW